MQRTTRSLSVLFSATAFASVVAAQTTDWAQLAPPSWPVARQNSSLAYDSVRGVSVLFGGWDGSQRRNDTWEWNGAVWNQVNTLNAPSPRDGMTMVYDAQRQVVVCTAGYVAPGETWEYDGADWAQVFTATTHAMGPHRPMTYDVVRGVCVLFGQSTASGNYETWEYDGVDWTLALSGGGPSTNGNLAYDLVRMRTVHFGSTGETWEYDGVAWTMATPAVSPPGAGCGSENMVYDLSRQVVVLYGGCPATVDTFEYDGITWQQVTTTNVPSTSLRYPAMTHDLSRQRTVLFGGRDLAITPVGVVDGTWEYGAAGTLGVNTPFGTGCGGLTIAATTRPVTGRSWDLQLANIPAGSIVGAILFGTSNPNLSLGALAPGCTQYSDIVGAAVLLPGTPSFGLAVPANPTLIGYDVFAQGITLTPGANPLGVWATAGLLGTVGDI